MSESRPLATRAEVADFLGLPVGTLTQWAHKGKGPEYIRIGRHARYDWAKVELWLNEQAKGGGGRAA
ncbi:MAG TPA: helix-turn-helix domain-containing protein [Amycolatopsis sp.]|uniref:helix-turn-helix transcriptional regulator n=1 Tax=Amycolatopsis sp. TaxID=37632 RepID=UPI002B46489B|nr:helix-turn-helix domain-containing protein [Amycolatopsis sp.]HKS46224.1 helix-turn-helix domain-containing protein [Amycolatopsis sp.]